MGSSCALLAACAGRCAVRATGAMRTAAFSSRPHRGRPDGAAAAAAECSSMHSHSQCWRRATAPQLDRGHAFAQVQGQSGCCRPDNADQEKAYTHAADRATCEDMCGRDGACLAYEFTLHRRMCEIYPVRVHAIEADSKCECWSRSTDAGPTPASGSGSGSGPGSESGVDGRDHPSRERRSLRNAAAAPAGHSAFSAAPAAAGMLAGVALVVAGAWRRRN